MVSTEYLCCGAQYKIKVLLQFVYINSLQGDLLCYH